MGEFNWSPAVLAALCVGMSDAIAGELGER
jgi:hypothetical protein